MISFPKSVKKTVDLLADEGAFTVNCTVADGRLIPALSPVRCGGNIPRGVIYAARAEGVNKFFLCTPTEVYASDDGVNFNLLCAYFADKPFLYEDIEDGVRRAVTAGGERAVVYRGGVAAVKSAGVKLSCAAVFCGRIFGADGDDKFRLRWSDANGAFDGEEGLYGAGRLDLDAGYGGVLDIAPYGGDLVLVREYGLTLLSAGGAPEAFSVRSCDLSSDKVCRGTAAVAGGRLFFFAASGLHSFDGNKITRVTHRFSSDIYAPVCAASAGGKYFLSCRSRTAGGAVFCLDTESGSAYLIGIGADALCAADGIFAYNSGGAYKLEEGGGFYFTSDFDFGTGCKKTVTQIFIDCESADIELTSGKLTRTFKNASGIIRPNMRGKKFTVKVAAAGPVHRLTATAEAAIGI